MDFPPPESSLDDREEIIRRLEAEITVLRERDHEHRMSEFVSTCNNSSVSMTDSLINAALEPLLTTISISKTIQSFLDPNRK